MVIPSLAAMGPAWQQERNIRQRMKEEGDEEEEAWHVRVAQSPTLTAYSCNFDVH